MCSQITSVAKGVRVHVSSKPTKPVKRISEKVKIKMPWLNIHIYFLQSRIDDRSLREACFGSSKSSEVRENLSCDVCLCVVGVHVGEIFVVSCPRENIQHLGRWIKYHGMTLKSMRKDCLRSIMVTHQIEKE